MHFTPVSSSATIERTYTVSGAPPFTIAARVRNPERPDAMLTIAPDMITVTYANIRDEWELTGIEIHGYRDGTRRLGIARFIPGVHEAPPAWAADLAAANMPTRPLD